MRRSIYVDGLSHGAHPIPAASVVDGLLFTAAIFGRNRTTGELAEGLDTQCEQMFANVEAILEAAGATFDHVAKITFFLRPQCSRDPINAVWQRAFPDKDSRPARHVLLSDTLPAGQLVQCELVAVLPFRSRG